MEKNRIRPVKAGKSMRMSYSRQKEVLEMPNLIEIQRDSYQWFLDEGLKEVFDDISPIADYSGQLSLEFVDFTLCKDDVKYTIPQCKERDATYAAPLKVKVRLYNKETDEINEHEIFMGDLPLMTETGTFVINGAERVIVSQLVRSPGIYYAIGHDKVGKELYSCTVIPNRGAWLEYETDSNDVFYVRVDRTRKVPISVLIRALGVGTNQQIIDLFGEEPKLLASFGKDPSITEKEPNGSYEGGLLELYRKIRPGEPLTVESAESLISAMFFDPRRYDLAKVGRYKFNKKLALRNRINGQILAEDVVDETTGEILAEAGKVVNRELADAIQNAAVPYVWVQAEERNVKVLSNMMVDISNYVDFDTKALGVNELVYYPVLAQILEENETAEDLADAIKKNIHDLIPKHITREDIFASINYNMHLEYGVGHDDDIDHLGNRRIRAVGELLQNQYRIGLSRLERVVRERMTTQDLEGISPQSLINIKPVTAAVKEFFGSSQLSQFMDQNNPLGELTHKRRLSALGPGGLSRDRAGFEVRDVHYSHYGRMCPIETPEGPNIGLINSLASYARINEYGFIEAPYRKIDKSDPQNPRVTDEVVYMTADEEDNYHVAQANEKLDEEGHFVRNSVSGRFREETQEYDKLMFDYMDVSPKMVFSVATALIPFLQNDDANRALMGSNMQRQAVPLLTTEAPVVGTGMEPKAAVDSGVCVVAKHAGVVERSESNRIIIRTEDGDKDEYILTKFSRSNQSNCYNQRPIVFKGDRVEEGEVIADGPSTSNGELALGKNPLIGFMTWEGYNYEDAVLLSERLVQDDVYTSIHMEEYEAEARDTKLGPEEITRDVPGVGDDALKALDERGIIRIGAEVRAGDILVGKVTPKGETELTAEESKRVFQALIINNMPDNRIYRYNFLHDNCATRPRNVITENLSGQIQYKDPDEKVTFREMIHDCTHNYPWLTFGIDLALGAPLDRTISYEEQMFLPDVLMGAFEDARVVKGDSVRHLSGEPVLLLAADPMRMTSATVRPTGISPLFAASLLLSVVVVISVVEIIKRRYYRIVDTILFSIYGLVGCLLFFLMFISTHPATFPNYSGFWANPFLLILPVIIWVKSMKRVVCYYHFINFAVLFCLLASWYWLPQQMNIAFLPLVLALAVRSVTYIWVNRRKEKIAEKEI